LSVYFAIPSKRPPAEAEKVLSKWRAQGYKIALWRDLGDPPIPCDLALSGKYRGYHVAVNVLVHEILRRDPEATWICTGGDDVDPVANMTAEQIAAECTAHFKGTFGVMQPGGDKWCTPNTFCGSPWMGREFCRRMYGGHGPFSEAYFHMYGDNEMFEVAQKMKILWVREELTHYHHHWQRENQKEPDFLKVADSCYAKLGQLFRERKLAGFPGHEPIP
jgi:hypothetical protein